MQNVIIAHPEAEAALLKGSASESTEPGVRALLKVLLAMGTFALGQDRAERTIIAIAAAQSKDSGTWLN